MATSLRVLLIEDNEDDASLLLYELRRGGYDATAARVDTAEALRTAFTAESWDLVTCNWVMPQLSAPAALQLLRELQCEAPIIIVSGEVGEEFAVGAMKAGAHDFISKHRLARLVPAVQRELHEAEVRRAHRRAEAALRDSEQRFRLMADTAPVMIWVTGPDGRCLYLNQRWTEFTGRPLDAELGEGWLTAVHPDDDERLLKASVDAFNQRRSFTVEYRARRADGVYRWLLISGTPRLEADGTLGGFIGSGVDITERKSAESDLRRSQEQLRALSGRLQHVRDDESARIARELHDELGQALTALKIDLALLCRSLPPASETNDVRTRMDAMGHHIDSTIDAIRRIASDLRPGVLDDLGLPAAIEWQAREFQARTGIRCVLETNPGCNQVPQPAATALFRIFQETLTNVARHASATHVHVVLREEAGRVLLKVADDGIGISDAAQHDPNALGLLGMRERALHLGGDVTIHGVPERGTTVIVTIPHPDDESEGQAPATK